MRSGSTDTEAPHPRFVLNLAVDVLRDIYRSIGARQAETGGLLGGANGAATVSRYHFDTSSRNTATTYTPDHETLTRLLQNGWNPAGIRLRGFAHSHPGESRQPSRGDEIYAIRILGVIPDLPVLWLPIANSIPETGRFRLTPWAAVRAKGGVRIVRASLRVVPAVSTGQLGWFHRLARGPRSRPVSEISIPGGMTRPVGVSA